MSGILVTDSDTEDRPLRIQLPWGAEVNLTRGNAAKLRDDIDEWFRENRKIRRRGVRPSRPHPSVPSEAQAWPPDPVWGTDDRGRFHYTDYDGESLHVWRDKDGELWIDKKGEGPVYVRPQDVTLMVESLGLPPLDTDKLLSDVREQFGVGWDAIKAAQNGAHLTEAEKAMGLDGK